MPSSTTQLFDTNRVGSSLPSGEKATDLTESKWPSSVCCSAPVTASQSWTVLSPEPETTCLPSGEKATEKTEPEWPSSVCSAAFQFPCTFGFLLIQGGTYSSNYLGTILFSGAKTRAEQYSCSGDCSITARLYKANRLVSWINAYKLGLSST
jgi:hypothetical protein